MLDFSFLLMHMSLSSLPHLITFTDALHIHVEFPQGPNSTLLHSPRLQIHATKVFVFHAPAKQTLSCPTPASITEPVLNLFTLFDP